MEERVSGRPQKVSLLNRSVGTITGVQEVQGFNETEISLDTDLGQLVIRGTGSWKAYIRCIQTLPSAF